MAGRLGRAGGGRGGGGGWGVERFATKKMSAGEGAATAKRGTATQRRHGCNCSAAATGHILGLGNGRFEKHRGVAPPRNQPQGETPTCCREHKRADSGRRWSMRPSPQLRSQQEASTAPHVCVMMMCRAGMGREDMAAHSSQHPLATTHTPRIRPAQKPSPLRGGGGGGRSASGQLSWRASRARKRPQGAAARCTGRGQQPTRSNTLVRTQTAMALVPFLPRRLSGVRPVLGGQSAIPCTLHCGLCLPKRWQSPAHLQQGICATTGSSPR